MLNTSLFRKLISGRVLSFIIVVILFLIIPVVADEFLIHVFILFFVWSIVAQSWNFLLSFSNIWAFGNLVFFAAGGYAAGYLSMVYKLPPLLGLMIGFTIGGLAGLVIGVPTLRLRAIYLALFTFASEEFLRHVIVQTELVPITGGPIGLQSIPRFSIQNLPYLTLNYYIGLALFLFSILFLFYISRSRAGWALRVIASSIEVAESIRIDTYKYRLLAFLIASSLTGLSGAFYAYYFGSITPKVLSFELLVTIIFMIVVGGPHSFYGPLLGAALLTFVNEYMKGIFLGVTAHLRVITMGLLIILILRAYPGGLVGVAESVVNKLGRSTNTLKKE
jgi:branched-chain amino acid transport system permease protein